jgi:AsmA protein
MVPVRVGYLTLSHRQSPGENRNMQRLIVGTLVVVAILAGGAALLPRLLPEHEVRLALTRALMDATGTEPRIYGGAKLTLLPRPVIRLEGVRLDDGRHPGVTSGSLVAEVRLAPLFTGSIEIGALTFERPHLALELGVDGIRIAGLPLNLSAPPDTRAGAPELRIVDGIVELRTAAGVRTLTAVEASLAWAGAGLTASGTFELDRRPVAATMVVADIAALRNGDRSALRLRLEAENQRFTFDGGLAFRNGPQIEGVLAADGRSLRNALAWLGIEAPARGGFGPYSLKTRLAFTPGSLALSALAVELDGNLAEGGVTLKHEAGRAVLQGTLASELIDLTRYAGAKPEARASTGWLSEPIDLAALQALDLDVRLSARRVLIQQAELNKAALTLTLKGGRLTLAVGEAQLFGGTLRGTAVLAPAQTGADVKIDAKLTDFDLERGLAALTGIRRLEGSGVLTVMLQSSGASPEAIARDLSGDASLAVTGGAITGINVEQILRRLDRKPLSGFGDLRGGRTPFERFVAKVRFAEGSATLEEIQIESALVHVSLAGSASMARREFDLRGTASLTRPSPAVAGTLARFELPFLLQGPWDNPLLLPDADALIRRSGAAAPLLDAERNRVPRGAVRTVIESLTGPRPAVEQPTPDQPSAATPAPTPR